MRPKQQRAVYDVVFVQTPLESWLGYYDDDEDERNAIVYVGNPLDSEYGLVPFEHMFEATADENRKFRGEHGFHPIQH